MNFENNAIKNKVELKSCVDGDTANYIYNNKNIKVRFLAIDSPELEHDNQKEEPYAKAARDYTCNELNIANNIYLEFDDKAEKLDKYNRHLAWVFVDNNLLQEKIVTNGYAKVAYLYDDYKYTKTLKKQEKIAKRKKRGIWSNEKEDNYYYFLIPFTILIILIMILKIKK